MEKPPFLSEVMLWIQTQLPWLGHLIVSIIGGITAHIREWETKYPSYTMRQHVFALLRRSFLSITAGLMWYYIAQGYAWSSSPFSYVGAALVGLFAPDFFDLLWDIFKTRLLGAVNGQKRDGGPQ